MRRRASVRRVVLTTVAALLLGGLLNAGSLAATASNQPAGWRRDVAVAATRPLLAVSQALGLDRPRAWIDQATGRGQPAPTPDVDPSPDAPTPEPTAPEPTTPASPEPDPTPSASPSPTSPPSVSPSDPEPTPTGPVTPSAAPIEGLVATAEDPARLLVVGDSLTEAFGPALVNIALGTRVLDPDHELRYSSGLTRPDFFDWPARIDQLLRAAPTDIVVFMIGANDGQAILTDGTWVSYGTPGWSEEYRRRVERTADILSAGARSVYWIGQPIARSSTYREKMATMNAIYREAAAARPNVRYVSSWELFTAPDGGYSDYLPDASGRSVLVRRTDGIHLTVTGGEWLARHVFTAIDQDWALG